MKITVLCTDTGKLNAAGHIMEFLQPGSPQNATGTSIAERYQNEGRKLDPISGPTFSRVPFVFFRRSVGPPPFAARQRTPTRQQIRF